jgi:hypothetical protein
MAYTKAADGVAKKGKTDVKVFPNSGPTASNPKGGKGGGKKGGVTSEAMMKVGRNMARANNQTGG